MRGELVYRDGSNNIHSDLISRDGTKKIVVSRDIIKIVSTVTNEVIKEKRETRGDPRALGFSDDGEKVLYISYHRGGAFVSTSLTVWDSMLNKSWAVDDHRVRYITKVSCNGDFSLMALSGEYGVSLVYPYDKGRVWYRTLCFFSSMEDADIESLSLDEEKGIVWVSHQKGFETLTIQYGVIQSRYLLPSEVVMQ